MDAVYTLHTSRRRSNLNDAGFDQLITRLSSRWATAATLLLLGLFRLIYWAAQLFSASGIAP